MSLGWRVGVMVVLVVSTGGVLLAGGGTFVQQGQEICTVRPVKFSYPTREFTTITGAVIARQEESDSSKPETDPTRYDPTSAFLCDIIRIGPNPKPYSENVKIGARGKPLIIEPSGEGGQRLLQGQLVDGYPAGQAILIEGAKDVTVEGLSVTQGRTGVLVQSSSNVTIRNMDVHRNTGSGISVQASSSILIEGVKVHENEGAGILVGKSQKVSIRGTLKQPRTLVYDNKADGIGVGADAQVEISDVEITNNKEGLVVSTTVKENGAVVVVGGPASVTLRKSVIKDNDQHGISVVEGSTADVTENEISKQKKGCGVNVDAKSQVQDSIGRSNWIFANKGGNTCPSELAQRIRKPEIIVPNHFDKLQDAIDEAEPIKAAGDPIYTIVIKYENTYRENLCIDRSVTIQAQEPVILQAIDTAKPVIRIATDDCPLQEQGSTGQQTSVHLKGTWSDRKTLIGWLTISGTIMEPSNTRTKVGVQIGTMHKDPNWKGILDVTLKDVLIENQFEAGIKVNSKAHSLIVTFTSELEDADCSRSDRRENHAVIRNNAVGVLANIEQGSVTLNIENAAIIKNDRGGVFLINTAPLASLKATLNNVVIQENASFGVHVEGAVQATLKTESEMTISPKQDPKDRPHYCGINDNFGPGIRIYGPTSGTIPASVTIDNLHILGNGYTDKKKNNYISRKKEDQWAGPDGIFAHGFVKLNIQNSHIGSADGVNGNAGIGIALSQPTKPEKEEQRLDAKIINNLIEHNGEWGVAYVVRLCVNIPGVSSNFFGKDAEGYGNTIMNNRWRIPDPASSYSPSPQVCPADNLQKLMQKP